MGQIAECEIGSGGLTCPAPARVPSSRLLERDEFYSASGIIK